MISKAKLIEVSCVPVPANQDALATAVSKGLITRDRATKMFGSKVVDGMPTQNQTPGNASTTTQTTQTAEQQHPAATPKVGTRARPTRRC